MIHAHPAPPHATLAYRSDTGSRQSVKVYIRATNLTNQFAFTHALFIRYLSRLRGRNIVLGVRHQF